MKAPIARSADPRAQRSRAALCAALGDMLGAIPLEQITILALTERAGVGYATFFRNYEDIDGVLFDLSAALIDELASLLAPTAGCDSVTAEAIAAFADARKAVLRPLFVGASATLQRDIIARASAVARDRAAPPDGAIPPEVRVVHPVVVVIALLTWWLGADGAESAEELARLIDKLAFQPLG